MTRSTEWTRVRPVLERILALPEERREGALERECGDDEVLRERVRALLAAGRAHSALFEPLGPSLHDGSDSPSGIEPGASIGAWRLDRELGRGGMGDVWLVTREGADFRQRGALKVVRRGLDTDLVLARFLRERRVLAELAHPNIPRLVDGGATEDGRPYFVMEYVEGTPIDAFVRERSLEVEARVLLLVLVF